ncbi:MAG: S-methyl-5'-thioadenosine phosphorylase, partial [Firmicutes bacterium]|nr:S-methyl-5'-thioadenosine phosphorylase [Bacillota bacterium]
YHWSVINMTGYPEAILARELEICYVNISLITDYDVGLEGQKGIKPVSHSEVIKVFNSNNEKVKKMIIKMIEKMPAKRTCTCGEALKTAR